MTEGQENEGYLDAIEFLKEAFRGWISNMMKDFDAQGIVLPAPLIADALMDLSNEISGIEIENVDEFIKDVLGDE